MLCEKAESPAALDAVLDEPLPGELTRQQQREHELRKAAKENERALAVLRGHRAG